MTTPTKGISRELVTEWADNTPLEGFTIQVTSDGLWQVGDAHVGMLFERDREAEVLRVYADLIEDFVARAVARGDDAKAEWQREIERARADAAALDAGKPMSVTPAATPVQSRWPEWVQLGAVCVMVTNSRHRRHQTVTRATVTKLTAANVTVEFRDGRTDRFRAPALPGGAIARHDRDGNYSITLYEPNEPAARVAISRARVTNAQRQAVEAVQAVDTRAGAATANELIAQAEAALAAVEKLAALARWLRDAERDAATAAAEAPADAPTR